MTPSWRMLGLLPVDVLLMVALGKLVGIHVFDVTGSKRSRFIIGSQCLAGRVSHRPSGAFHLGGFAPVVAGTADLDGHAHGQLGRVDDGLALFKHSCFGQGRMPGALPVAGFAGDARLDKSFFSRSTPVAWQPPHLSTQGRLSQSASW